MCRLRAVVDRWFFLRSVRLTLDSTLEHAHAYTRSVRAFGINLPLCDSQPIFFFRFFSLPSPSFPFPSFFASSASLAPSASPREHVSCRCFFVRYHLSRLINHYRKFRQKTTSFVRAPDTRLVGTSCHSLTVFSLSLSLYPSFSVSPPIFPNALHNRAFSRTSRKMERFFLRIVLCLLLFSFPPRDES